MCSVACKDCFMWISAKCNVDGVWVFLHLQCPRWCLHRLGMRSVAPKLSYVVPDGVCIGWACALWPQRLFYVDSKGNVKQFFGLRFGRFSARV